METYKIDEIVWLESNLDAWCPDAKSRVQKMGFPFPLPMDISFSIGLFRHPLVRDDKIGYIIKAKMGTNLPVYTFPESDPGSFGLGEDDGRWMWRLIIDALELALMGVYSQRLAREILYAAIGKDKPAESTQEAQHASL